MAIWVNFVELCNAVSSNGRVLVFKFKCSVFETHPGHIFYQLEKVLHVWCIYQSACFCWNNKSAIAYPSFIGVILLAL